MGSILNMKMGGSTGMCTAFFKTLNINKWYGYKFFWQWEVTGQVAIA